MRKKIFAFALLLVVLVGTWLTFGAWSPRNVENVETVDNVMSRSTIYWNSTFRFKFPVDPYFDSGEEFEVLFVGRQLVNGSWIRDSERYIIDDMDYLGNNTYEIVTELDVLDYNEFWVYCLIERVPEYLPAMIFDKAYICWDGANDIEVFANAYPTANRKPFYNGLYFKYTEVEDFAYIQIDFQSTITYEVYNEVVSERNDLANDLSYANDRINTLMNEITRLEDKLGAYGAGDKGLGFIETAFIKVGEILKIEVLPGIRIGTFLAVPLILGVVFLILRLVRGE